MSRTVEKAHLADELDRMNAAWDAQVRKDLAGTSLWFPHGPFDKGSGES
jgi:hypothetical protein